MEGHEMSNVDEGKESNAPREQPQHRVRLPGFIADDEIGLGDLIRRATSYVGIKACGGCEQRARALNGWLVFAPRHQR
jgi:hypothetical protein